MDGHQLGGQGVGSGSAGDEPEGQRPLDQRGHVVAGWQSLDHSRDQWRHHDVEPDPDDADHDKGGGGSDHAGLGSQARVEQQRNRDEHPEQQLDDPEAPPHRAQGDDPDHVAVVRLEGQQGDDKLIEHQAKVNAENPSQDRGQALHQAGVRASSRPAILRVVDHRQQRGPGHHRRDDEDDREEATEPHAASLQNSKDGPGAAVHAEDGKRDTDGAKDPQPLVRPNS